MVTQAQLRNSNNNESTWDEIATAVLLCPRIAEMSTFVPQAMHAILNDNVFFVAGIEFQSEAKNI